MIKSIGNFFLEGLKEAGAAFLGAIVLIACVAFVMGPLFLFAHLGDIWHPAWAFGGWIFWIVVLSGIGKKMGW
jgi:hypothetical protein